MMTSARTSRHDERLGRVDDLIGRSCEIAASHANRTRGRTYPAAIFTLEDPIASAQIFDYDVNHYFEDPLFYVEQTLRQKIWRWETFPEDELPFSADLPAWLGYYPEFTFVGLEVTFGRDGVPFIQTDHPLTRDPDCKLLHPVDFKTSGWMPRILRWWDDINEIIAGRLGTTFEMIWWRGCLDLAIQLRGYDRLMLDIKERPGFVHDLLGFLTEQRMLWYEGYYRHLGLQVQPGTVADDWINIPFISPRIFTEFVLPRYREIEAYHGRIVSVHSCGNQTPIQRSLLEIETLETVECSPWTDLVATVRNVPSDKHLQVALHPNDVLFATPEQMETKLRAIADTCEGRHYDINTSGLTPILETVDAYISQIRTWQVIAQKVLEDRRRLTVERTDNAGEHRAFHCN